MTKYTSDPFLMGPREVNDPFMTNAAQRRPSEQMMNIAGSGERRRHSKGPTWDMGAVFQPAEKEQGRWAVQLLVFLPWLLFLLTLLLWLVLKHTWEAAVTFIVAVQIVLSLACVAVGQVGKDHFKYPIFGLGVLCLLATVAALLVGMYGWDNYARQYWWTVSGPVYSDISPTTAADTYLDAAVLNFRTSANLTLEASAVDTVRSAGFRDTDIYCVAPVLSGPALKSSITRVQYWAIGINCCENVGNFHCDDSRNAEGSAGVVMLNGGMPCAGCNKNKFSAAVSKAETLFDFVSSPNAVFVRWVTTSSSISSSLYWKVFMLAVFSVIVVLALFCMAAAGRKYYVEHLTS